MYVGDDPRDDVIVPEWTSFILFLSMDDSHHNKDSHNYKYPLLCLFFECGIVFIRLWETH